MEFKNSIKVRITSSIWCIILIFLSTYWWAVCIAEWISKMKNKQFIKNMSGTKTGYFEILIGAYRDLWRELTGSIREIKLGVKLWK